MNQRNDGGASIAASSLASVESAGNIGIITLRNQGRRNALSHDMMHALTAAFAPFRGSENSRCGLEGRARGQGVVRRP